jgi:hypothetical protein
VRVLAADADAERQPAGRELRDVGELTGVEEHGATASDRVQLWLVGNHNCTEKRLLDA